MSDDRTTSTYQITTSLPKSNCRHEQNAGYEKLNNEKFIYILENLIVESLFKYKVNLHEEDPANKLQDTQCRKWDPWMPQNKNYKTE